VCKRRVCTKQTLRDYSSHHFIFLAVLAGFLLLSDNELTGNVQNAFNRFTNLNFIDLSDNSLAGSIPSSLFGLANLEFVYLNNNRFTGPIPNNWGNAGALRDLYIQNNDLSGEVPPIEQGQLSQLSEFLLEFNDMYVF